MPAERTAFAVSVQALDFIPSPLFGLLLVAVLSLIIELGYRFGLKLSGKAGERGLSKHPMEASVTTALIGLMAFILGFSFSMASKRYSDLRALALADANHASTLMLRADLLPEEEGARARELIREYVEMRQRAVDQGDAEHLGEALKRSTEIQQELWEPAVKLRKETGDASLNLYLTTLNQLIDNDAARRAKAFSNRFPDILWFTLFFLVTLVTTMIGVNSGLHGRRSRLAGTALIVAFSLVIVLIVDLDRPSRSLVRPAGAGTPGEMP